MRNRRIRNDGLFELFTFEEKKILFKVCLHFILIIRTRWNKNIEHRYLKKVIAATFRFRKELLSGKFFVPDFIGRMANYGFLPASAAFGISKPLIKMSHQILVIIQLRNFKL